MSGSGGGGNWRETEPPGKGGGKPGSSKSGGGAGGGDDSSDQCNITERATLNSPNRSVIVTLSVGDELEVKLLAGPPRQLVASRGNSVAGSITSPKSAKIIQCIALQKRAYVAIVLSIRGGICSVEVRPK